MTVPLVETLLADLVNNESGRTWSSYSLDGIRALLARAGNPHEKLSYIHIAGTNGKGSTAHMIEYLFRRAGYKTGLYTSPHLLRYNERIRLNGLDIPDDELADLVKSVLDLSRQDNPLDLTFFDIMTAVSLACFSAHDVDIAVIEAGMGGRLDSTNIITPLCSVITSISMDHTAILGSNIIQIAGEKAGIIKSGIPVVVGMCRDSVMHIFEKEAGLHNSPIYRYGSEFTVTINHSAGCNRCRYTASSPELQSFQGDISLGVDGDIQCHNASLAVTSAILLRNRFDRITDNICSSALADITIPGRMEILGRNPDIFFDPAHNPAAIENLAQTISMIHGPDKPVIVMTLMADKDSWEIWNILERYNFSVIYYELTDHRSLSADELKRRGHQVAAIASSVEELKKTLHARLPAPVFFTGSFRLYSTAVEYALKTI